MSLRILKAGLLDTIQDAGRWGFQHLGVNPGGVMDVVAMRIANMLVGNNQHEGVIEMHFPAAQIHFQQDAMIALAGADFNARVNDLQVPVNCCTIIKAGSILSFTKQLSGARTYLAVSGGLNIPTWLNSKSTNLKACAGGFGGRAVQKADIIEFNRPCAHLTRHSRCLPWKANPGNLYHQSCIRFIAAAEYPKLEPASAGVLCKTEFTITEQSDRMGFRLRGPVLLLKTPVQLVSAGVTNGTMQLLPNGQVIVLMADHQTTGGYPRIGHVIGADIPRLAQKRAGEQVRFEMVDIALAEKLLYEQHLHLLKLEHACMLRLDAYWG